MFGRLHEFPGLSQSSLQRRLLCLFLPGGRSPKSGSCLTKARADACIPPCSFSLPCSYSTYHASSRKNLHSAEASAGPPLARRAPWWETYAALVRLHAPVGTWLLYWPCVFSICLATPVTGTSATAAAAKSAATLPSVAALIAAAASSATQDEEEDVEAHQQQQPQLPQTQAEAGAPQRYQQQEQQVHPSNQERQSELPQSIETKSDVYKVWARAGFCLSLCGLGAFLMRSAGCIVNDIWDRSFDSKVERTRGRPLASGALGLRGALGALGALLLPSLWVLMQFNTYTVGLGLSSLSLVTLYPAMKRLISLPQLFLGLTFSWGALLGWAALLGPQGMPAILGGQPTTLSLSHPASTPAASASNPTALGLSMETEACSPPCVSPRPSSMRTSLIPVEWAPVCLYLGCVLWTLTYDTLYAFQDVKDDRRIGVRSSAVTWGPRGARFWGSLSILGQATLWGLAGAPLRAPGPYLLGVCACCAWLGRLLWFTDLRSREACGKAFKTNHKIGALFASSIVASKAMELLTTTTPQD
ncbi:hypothetical protein Emag_005625 [Eimeria magna]